MRIRFILGLALLAGCARSGRDPRPLPPVIASVPSTVAPPPEPSHSAPAYPSRTGQCNLDKAVDAFLLGQPATRCGDLDRRRPSPAQVNDLRDCVLAAYRDKRPFTASWVTGTVDSLMRIAFVGRDLGDRLEVRWFSYDSCPHGCGDADPVWSSMVCETLEDVRALCKALAKSRRRPPKIDNDLRWLCEEDEDTHRRRESFDLRCLGAANSQLQCGWPELLERERAR